MEKNKQYVQINILSFVAVVYEETPQYSSSFDVKRPSYVPSLAINISFFSIKVLKQKLKLVINIRRDKKNVILNRHVVVFMFSQYHKRIISLESSCYELKKILPSSTFYALCYSP